MSNSFWFGKLSRLQACLEDRDFSVHCGRSEIEQGTNNQFLLVYMCLTLRFVCFFRQGLLDRKLHSITLVCFRPFVFGLELRRFCDMV
jgi:hypothetical protein